MVFLIVSLGGVLLWKAWELWKEGDVMVDGWGIAAGEEEQKEEGKREGEWWDGMGWSGVNKGMVERIYARPIGPPILVSKSSLRRKELKPQPPKSKIPGVIFFTAHVLPFFPPYSSALPPPPPGPAPCA